MKSTSRLRNVLNLTIFFLLLLSSASCAVTSAGAGSGSAYSKKALVGDWNLVGASTETYRNGALVAKEEGAPEAPASSVLLGRDGWAFLANRIGAWDYAENRLVISNGIEQHRSYELLSLSRSAMVIRWEYQGKGDTAASGNHTYIVGEYAR